MKSGKKIFIFRELYNINLIILNHPQNKIKKKINNFPAFYF